MAVKDYEMVDGLLHRKVRTPEGEMASVPVIPDGGVKSALVNGKRRMLTWRNMILHVLRNSTAGGHLGAHALEQRAVSYTHLTLPTKRIV